MEIIKTIQLSHPVTGRQVMDAIKLLVENQPQGSYEEALERSIDDVDEWVVGVFSPYPYKQVAVFAVEDDNYKVFLKEDEEYERLAVVNHQWAGSIYPVGYNDKAVKNAVSEFHEKLTIELTK